MTNILNVNHVGNYNGKFLSPNSALPICGVALFGMYKNNLQQGLNTITTQPLTWGLPVQIETMPTTNPTNAGKALNPNVLQINTIATTDSNLSGFIVKSQTDILMPGDEAAASRQGQISYVACFGSNVELYLPCDTSLIAQGSNSINHTANFDFDFTNMCFKTGTAFTLNLKSNVVDGLIPYFDSTSNSVKLKNTKCIKVRL